MQLSNCQHWVFDMDGTLTVAVHDFMAIRQALEIPFEADILHHLAALPEAEAKAKHAWLLAHERELALRARPATGAHSLLQQLKQQGCHIGLLTRNARELALITLAQLELLDFFEPAAVLGRNDAPPKPDPGGLLQLAHHWQVNPNQLVMVGDFSNDLEAARSAGARNVLVNVPNNPWPELTDLQLPDCSALAQYLQDN